jgi:hypothetical protein
MPFHSPNLLLFENTTYINASPTPNKAKGFSNSDGCSCITNRRGVDSHIDLNTESVNG